MPGRLYEDARVNKVLHHRVLAFALSAPKPTPSALEEIALTLDVDDFSVVESMRQLSTWGYLEGWGTVLSWYPVSDPKRGEMAAIRQALIAEGFLDNPCALCGARSQHVDHVIPLSRRGSNERSNFQPLCAPCNIGKGARQ